MTDEKKLEITSTPFERMEQKFNALLDGNVSDPTWLRAMQKLLDDPTGHGPQVSSFPWDVGTVDDEPHLVCITNREHVVIAKCGLVEDAASCFDAMLITAAVNAIWKRVRVATE